MGDMAASMPDETVAETARVSEVAQALEACFEMIRVERMDGIPILNDALSVSAVGFRLWNGHCLGVLLTPWFMNIVLLPMERTDGQDSPPITVGTKRSFAFPAGSFEFIHGHEPLIGPHWMCSLFSPVFEFSDQETAIEAARAALDEILDLENAIESQDESDMAMIWRGELPAFQEGQAATPEDDVRTVQSDDTGEESAGLDDRLSERAADISKSQPATLSRRGFLTGQRSFDGQEKDRQQDVAPAPSSRVEREAVLAGDGPEART